jgi:hypothetical protein
VISPNIVYSFISSSPHMRNATISFLLDIFLYFSIPERFDKRGLIVDIHMDKVKESVGE